MDVDCEVEDIWPSEIDWSSIAELAGSAAASVAPELDSARLVVSILFTGDDEVQGLNRQWRDKDKPTNVLSFPMLNREQLLGLRDDGCPEMLGDIALAVETCARESAQKGVSLEAHATHLIVHGLLHLAGYDHETGPEDAQLMESLEIKALAILGIKDPYGDLE